MNITFDRRRALKLIAGSGVTCATCVALGQAHAAEKKGHGAPAPAPAAAPAAEASAHGGPGAWSYEGASSPEHWGELSPGFKSCDLGVQQSPVDLSTPIQTNLGEVQIHWRSMTPAVVNNGRTIQVNTPKDNFIVLEGERFDLLQFHFHHPSEHLVSGRSHAMEVHFVHKSEAGALAVIGVFLTPGRENTALQTIWDVMPQAADATAKTGSTIRPADLLPVDRNYFRYAGSLTTPPCSEIVNWVVYRAPIEASDAQITKFAHLFPMNARPAQRLHRRFLLMGRS
ncbi:MAG: carbonic anhydrase family protein [Alphaproteobacteria bacterium]|nr:carbonic anhydrase family protein [Alphaproteobacteria bacterium]